MLRQLGDLQCISIVLGLSVDVSIKGMIDSLEGKKKRKRKKRGNKPQLKLILIPWSPKPVKSMT